MKHKWKDVSLGFDIAYHKWKLYQLIPVETKGHLYATKCGIISYKLKKKNLHKLNLWNTVESNCIYV